MNDTNTAEDDGYDEFFESDEYEALCEDLWERARLTAQQHWDETEARDRIPPPEQSLAHALLGMQETVSLEHQKMALHSASEIGEEMIRRAEIELADMRRAVAALQRPRSELLRSRIGIVKA